MYVFFVADLRGENDFVTLDASFFLSRLCGTFRRVFFWCLAL